jgi:hypothetical protein
MRLQFGGGLFFTLGAIVFLLSGAGAAVAIPILLAVAMYTGAFVQWTKLRRESRAPLIK